MYATKRNQDLMNALFNDIFDWSTPVSSRQYETPKMNISESDGDYELALCVPGLKKEHLMLSIDAENNLIVEMVSSEGKQETAQQRHWLRHEFSEMNFKQTISLPDNVKKEQISAKVEDGILHITLPKITKEEMKALTQTITIQ